MNGAVMRWYRLHCSQKTSATPLDYDVWAVGVVDAFQRARYAGYWPLSVVDSSFVETIVT
jgi:hypothetical protein